MERLLITIGACIVAANTWAEAPNVAASLTFAHVVQADDKSFLDGGFGKTPFGGDDEGAALAGGYLELQSSFAPTWSATLTLTNAPDLDPALGVTEASLTYRPLPIGAARVRIKVGAFRPPVSF